MANNTFKIPSILDLKPKSANDTTTVADAPKVETNPFNSPLASPLDGLNAKNEYYVPMSNVKATSFGVGEQYVPVMIKGENGETTTVYKTPEEMKAYNQQKEAKKIAEVEQLKAKEEAKRAQEEHEAFIREQQAILNEAKAAPVEELIVQEEKVETPVATTHTVDLEALKQKIFEKAQQQVLQEAQQKALNEEKVEEPLDFNEPSEETDEDTPEMTSEMIEDSGFKPECYVSPHVKRAYKVPPFGLLKRDDESTLEDTSKADEQAKIINETLAGFGFGGEVVNKVIGPTVTLFEVKANLGVRVDSINQYEKTLQANLSAESIRILSPVPGRQNIGIEIPSAVRKSVKLGNILNPNDNNPFLIPLGKDISGNVINLNFQKVAHLLVAGMTGSGKSVCLNEILCSLIYKATPEEFKLVIIDPKRNEFIQYQHIPHLACPVITELDDAIAIFKWLVQEMENRSKLFCAVGARDISRYNELCQKNSTLGTIPHVIVVFDEFGDYIMKASKDFEDQVTLLGQKARSYGIHLILATQRPSKDIIAGSIKSNLTHTICFKTKDYTSSGVIIGHAGGEKLLGSGDMIYVDNFETRVQGAYVSDDEIEAITSFATRNNGEPNFMTDLKVLKTKIKDNEDNSIIYSEDFVNIVTYVVNNQCASVNKVQQVFQKGFNRVNSIFTEMENRGVISGTVPGKQREVLMQPSDLDQFLDELGVLH